MVPLISTRLAMRGIDPQSLLASTGLPANAMQTELTAPLSRINAFVDAAAARFGDPLFGLTLAEWVPPGAFGFPEFVMRASPTIHVALQSLCDFAALINPIGRFVFSIDDKSATLQYHVKGRPQGLGLHLNEYTLHLMIRMGHSIADGLVIERAWLPHVRSNYCDVVATRLGCPVQLGAPTVGYAIPRSELERKPRLADESLHAFLAEQARRLMARTGSDDLVSRLVRVLEDRLPTADLGIDAVAKSMAMSGRSLQRRLEESGTSYREVLDHVRHRRCRELRSAGVVWEEIATALGFADARSLRRAAERWEEPD